MYARSLFWSRSFCVWQHNYNENCFINDFFGDFFFGDGSVLTFFGDAASLVTGFFGDGSVLTFFGDDCRRRVLVKRSRKFGLLELSVAFDTVRANFF